MSTALNQVEIFRTEVSCPKTAAQLLQRLHEVFPHDKFNFDLEDCDRILRVDSPHLEIEAIPKHFQSWGYYCEWIE